MNRATEARMNALRDSIDRDAREARKTEDMLFTNVTNLEAKIAKLEQENELLQIRIDEMREQSTEHKHDAKVRESLKRLQEHEALKAERD